MRWDRFFQGLMGAAVFAFMMSAHPACAGDEKRFCEYAQLGADFYREVHRSARRIEGLLKKVEKSSRPVKYVHDFEEELSRLKKIRTDFSRQSLKLMQADISVLHYLNLKYADKLIRFTRRCVSSLYNSAGGPENRYQVQQLVNAFPLVTKDLPQAIAREADRMGTYYPGCRISRGFSFTRYLPIIAMAGVLIMLIYKH